MATKKRKKKPKARPRVKKPATPKAAQLDCVCGHCEESHPRLSGYLLVALGAMLVPVNMGLIPGFEFGAAWPILLVLVGAVLIARGTLCKK